MSTSFSDMLAGGDDGDTTNPKILVADTRAFYASAQQALDGCDPDDPFSILMEVNRFCDTCQVNECFLKMKIRECRGLLEQLVLQAAKVQAAAELVERQHNEVRWLPPAHSIIC